jgi:hypothetical protein
MRKYVRNMIRIGAEKQGYKASRAVRATFHELQIKRYGIKRRLANMCKSTHKRKLWRSRLNNAI